MTDPERPLRYRRRIRLQDFDYSKEGAYYITICTARREPLLATIDQGRVSPTNDGQTVIERWKWLAVKFSRVRLDEFILMPDHVHGILWLTDSERGGSSAAATRMTSLTQVVGAFKTMSARDINRRMKTPGSAVWERSFYERVIRNESELNRFRQYISDNPRRWTENLRSLDNVIGSGGA